MWFLWLAILSESRVWVMDETLVLQINKKNNHNHYKLFVYSWRVIFWIAFAYYCIETESNLIYRSYIVQQTISKKEAHTSRLLDIIPSFIN